MQLSIFVMPWTYTRLIGFGIVITAILLSIAHASAANVGLPMSFEFNQGDWAPEVKYVARGSGYTLFLAADEAILSLKKKDATEHVEAAPLVLRMQFPGRKPGMIVEALDELPGKANYLIGNDPRDWRKDVSLYRKVRYGGVYPGIDVVFYGNEPQLEYDFIVAPHASPQPIRIHFEGAEQVNIDKSGDLQLKIAGEEIRLHKPVAYQNLAGGRKVIAAQYLLLRGTTVGIRLGSYDHRQPLVIDPVLSYATYLGGTGADSAKAVAVDRAGMTYVTGTVQPGFPTINALQSDFGSLTGCESGPNGPFSSPRPIPCSNAFIAKLNPDGSAFVYITFLGGSGSESATGIAVDGFGNSYVTGTTTSSEFPLVNPMMIRGSSFIVKLNPAGSALLYSTRFGGNGRETNPKIAVDNAGNAYVTGTTTSSDFPAVNPVTGGLCASTTLVPFVMRLNSGGSSLAYSTCLTSGSYGLAQAVAVDPVGNAYVTGYAGPDLVTVRALQPSYGGGLDAFVSKLSPSGSLIYSTYLGGNDQDIGFGIAVDGDGSAYVTGSTVSLDFPIRNPFQDPLSPGGIDAFVTKLNASGSIVYSTYLGGSGGDAGLGIATDAFGNAYIAGSTGSNDFPILKAIQSIRGGGTQDAFVSKLNASGSTLLFSTYLGGRGNENAQGIALDSLGHISITGTTDSSDFPTPRGLYRTYNGVGGDVFVASIAEETAIAAYVIPELGGKTFTTVLDTPDVTMGYARIQPNPGFVPPDGVAIFGSRQNGALIAEQSVPAVAPIRNGRIYAQVAGSVTTGLALANGNDVPAFINFFFTNQNGINFGQGSFTIPANGQIAGFLNESPFLAGALNIQGTFTFTANVPIGVIALRGRINERSEFLSTTLPVASLSAATAEVLLLPHFADGGGWATEILLVNTTDIPQSGVIQFMSQGSASIPAQPLTMTVDGRQGTMFPYSISARSSSRLQTSNSGFAIQTGSVIVTPASGSFTPVGVLVFSFRRSGIIVSEAGVPAQPASRAFRMYAEASADIHKGSAGTVETGLAVANPSAVHSVTLTFELTTLSGDSTGITGRITLPVGGQAAMFLSEIPGFASLPTPFQGVLRISTDSDSGISVVGIRARYNERRDFLVTTTTPVDETSPPPTDGMIFPHLAVGAGYTTQLLLFSGHGQSSIGTVSLYTQQGNALEVALH